MANDTPNNIGGSNPNSLSDFGQSRVEEIGRAALRSPAEERELRRRARSARSSEEAYSQLDANYQGLPTFQRIHKHAVNTLSSVEPRIRIGIESRLERANSQAMNAVGREFSESRISGMVNQLSSTPEAQLGAVGMLSTPYGQLSQQRSSIMNQIAALGEQNAAMAGSSIGRRGVNPGAQSDMAANAQRAQELVRQLAPINVALRQQRQLGQDPESQMNALLNVGSRAESIRFKQGVGEDLKSGEFSGKSLDQLKQREAQLAQQLIEELSKLKDSAGKSAEEIDKMKDAAGRTAEDFKKTEEAIRQAGSAGGGGNRYTNASNMLNFASGAFGAAGGAINQIAVQQRLGQTQNIAGYAGIENQKYATYKAGAGGDVMSQLMLGQFAGSEAFGRELRAGANTAVGAQVAGGVAQIGAGGARVASTLSPVENVAATSSAMGNRLQGAQDILQGMATTATGGADIQRDVSGSGAAIAGVNAQTEARRQLMMVSAEQLQGFRDFGVGMGTAAIGMGARGAAFVQRNITKENLSKMTNARMSPEQMIQQAQFGVQNTGSTFNEGQIFAARGLERAGLGTISENMTRMSTLAAGGANNPQAGLGSVLEAAFSKSLDGSKVLNMMVENTGTMVQMSAGRAMGIDTTGASAQILAAGVNTADPNQEYAMQRAASAAERMKMIGTDTGMNFAAMSATARISKMTGLGGTEAIIAQQLDDSTLKAMKGMKPNEIRTKLFDRGIDVKEGQETRLVDQLTKARLITNIQGGAAGLATGVDASAIAEKMASGRTLTRAEQLAFNQSGTLAGFAGGAEKQRAATALLSEEPNQTTKSKVAGAMQGEGGSDQQKMLDDMRTQGFKQLSQAAQEATANFKSASDALKALGALAKSVEGIGDTGGEGKFKTAASDAAGTFGKSTMTFKTSVDEFTKAVGMMVSRSGISGSSADTQRMLDNLTAQNSKRGAGP